MKRILLFAIPPFIATLTILGFVYFLYTNSGRGALQVTSIPQSEVFLSGKAVGKTPLCLCESSDMVSPGEYTLRLVPSDASLPPFEQKIAIERSVLTVVDRTFRPRGESEGAIITLRPLSNKKTSEILVLSFPDQAEVYLDSNQIGKTPVLIRDVTESDHTMTLTKLGYREKELPVRTVRGYKLEALTFLGLNGSQKDKESQATPSATPTPATARVIILSTPTGFLRVREKPTVASAEITRVSPSDSFELLSEESGWFQIRLIDGRAGWVSAQYAQKAQ